MVALAIGSSAGGLGRFRSRIFQGIDALLVAGVQHGDCKYAEKQEYLFHFNKVFLNRKLSGMSFIHRPGYTQHSQFLHKINNLLYILLNFIDPMSAGKAVFLSAGGIF